MAAAVLTLGTAWADCRDDVGYTKLAAELGAGMPTGAGIKVRQVEASEGTSVTNYMPDTNNVEFAGKAFTNVNETATNASSHATTVGRYYYGLQTAMATGIADVAVHWADDWLDSFLEVGAMRPEPAAETRQVQSHSWIAADDSLMTNAVRRLDYAIARDGFVAIVAPNNGSGTTLPAVPTHSYNAICVGRSDGQHSSGGTRLDEAGRMKPDLVVPADATSWAAPIAASAVALLLDAATNAGLANAGKPECVKAIMMAGATKAQFPSWSRTAARPLDATYGAGQLNIHNSYRILTNGQHSAGSSNLLPLLGWDCTNIAAGTTSTYFFAVASNTAMTRFSVVLAWNRQITDDNPAPQFFDPVPHMANLEMEFWSATNFAVSTRLDLSTSTVDNVEHVFQRNLPIGQYAVRVSSDTNSSFALAWWGETVMLPRVAGCAVSNDGPVVITAEVSPSHTYYVQASTSLLPVAWINIGTNTPVTNLLQVSDETWTNYPVRFYRITLAE